MSPGGDENRAASDVNWAELLAWLELRARRLAVYSFGLDEGAGADASQEALHALLVHRARGARIHRPRGWLHLVVRRRLADACRKKFRLRERAEDFLHLPSQDAGPQERATTREFSDHFPIQLRRFPPPWRQIVELQFLAAWTRRDITAWLMTWRTVGPERCRQLIRESHEMLRQLRSSNVDLRTKWPSRFDATRNRWLTTPPPLLRLEGQHRGT